MSDKSLSLFQNAWFYNRVVSIDDLSASIGKLASVKGISQDHCGRSSNRLILAETHDFVFPSFLQKTIGGDTGKYNLHTVFQVASNSPCIFSGVQRMKRFIMGNERVDLLRQVSLEKAQFEFLYRGVPILIQLDPCGINHSEVTLHEPLRMRLEPFGSITNSLGFAISDSFGFYLTDSKGLGFMARTLVDDFLRLFDNAQNESERPVSNNILYCGVTDSSGYDVLQRLVEISQLDECQFLQSRIRFIIPHQVSKTALSSFLDMIEAERAVFPDPENQVQLSFFLNFGATMGFICDTTPLTDKAYDDGDLTGDDLEKYKGAHSTFLKEYVEWIAATAHLETVSGAIPAYWLAYDRKTRIGLVVLPIGNQFVLCQTPIELKKNFKASPAISSVFGSADDWVQGKPPIEGDFHFPVLNDKEDYGMGEATMPARPPFAFQDPLVWVRKLKEDLRNKGSTKTKQSAKPEPGSLDEQLAKLVAAGLELSPGITAMDFLLLDSEEEYRNNPYVSVFWQLTERNSDGVIFSPQALYHSRDDPSEEQMMEDFQRLCGEECRIENVDFEYYDKDDPVGHWLKYVRFTANGVSVEWFLGPDATEMGGLQILVEYFQSFFKERLNDRVLYETNAEYVLLCLSAEVAERIGKLSPLSEHPERE